MGRRLSGQIARLGTGPHHSYCARRTFSKRRPARGIHCRELSASDDTESPERF